MDKDKSKLPVAIKDVVIIGGGVVAVWLVIWVSFGSNPFYVVSSGSMEPVLQINDVLIVRDGGSWGELRVGDIIVFNRPDGGDRVIVHRIVDIDEDSDGDITIRTKGDANPSSIPGTDYPIREDDYIGKVIYVVPGIGVITKVISPPINYIIIAIILAILFFNRLGRKDSKGATQSGTDGSEPKTPMKPLDFTDYEHEKEKGEKLLCSVCGQRFATLEEYEKHRWTTCSGKGT